MKRSRVNYDKLKVICNGEPSKEAWKNFYNLLIDYHIQKYGKKIVRLALEESIKEMRSSNER